MTKIFVSVICCLQIFHYSVSITARMIALLVHLGPSENDESMKSLNCYFAIRYFNPEHHESALLICSKHNLYEVLEPACALNELKLAILTNPARLHNWMSCYITMFASYITGSWMGIHQNIFKNCKLHRNWKGYTKKIEIVWYST